MKYISLKQVILDAITPQLNYKLIYAFYTMKVLLNCHQCPANQSIEVTKMLPTDNNVYVFTCSNGHNTAVAFQAEKFQMLFEIGAFAIRDGYFSGAVTNITASLERFYEFAIRVILLKNNISLDQVAACWKQVAGQSERQIGAFTFLFLQAIGKPAQLLPDKMVAFRNKVIHKGYTPSLMETQQFGESVLTVIQDNLGNLMNAMKDMVDLKIMFTVQDQYDTARKFTEKISTMSVPLLISFYEPYTKAESLTAYLQEIKDSVR